MVHASSFGALLLAAAGAQVAQAASVSKIDNTKRDDLCSSLASAGLQDLLVLPGDAKYTEREASYWAPNAAIGPQCILLPQSTEDVARCVKTVTDAGAKFAIRSGGHSQWAGGSDVTDGVTIDMGSMTTVTYDESTKVASVQPGPKWGDVFKALEPYNVAVTGGRDADVGIGGFLTGGGNAYLSAKNGFGCDTVVNFEVVLVDGSIINANSTDNSDLWKALKGGWANFGVVTRFDIETTAVSQVWGLTQIHDASVGDQAADNLAKFTNENDGDRAAAHLVLRVYNTVKPGEIGVVTVAVDTDNKEDAPIFDDIRNVPAESGSPTHATLGELAETGIDPSDDRVHWFTMTFNNDPVIIKKAMSIHDALVEDLKTTFNNDTAFSTQCVLQPVPSFFGDVGASKGGNVLGLDAVDTNSILWLGTVAYSDPAFDEVAHQKLEDSYKQLEGFVKCHGGEVAWTYINYADKTQDPIKSYGEANINFMNQVAAKYDPNGVLQKQMPGSFKLSTA